jgi:LysR family transcriptional regulator, transcriptional activator of the cysJI operon
MKMTLRHLKIFITVADCGSMTNASEKLFIAQPTVSQAISELESYYGVKLFDRLSRRLYITETGKQFLSYARHIITLLDEMDQMMKNPDKCGVLKIGASLTIGACLLPALVKEFSRKYPSLKVQAVVKNTKDIEGLIVKNSIDFAIVEGIVHNTDMISSEFMDDELVLVCGKSHPLYGAQEISISSLNKLEFIVREPGSGTRELFENVMAANDIDWQLLWECNGSDGIKSAAVSGAGVAVISKLLIKSEVKARELAIIKVKGIEFKRKFNIIYHRNKYLTDSVKEFFELCYKIKVVEENNYER